jgi:hypothetical protein
MILKKISILLLLFCCNKSDAVAQDNLYARYTTNENRDKIHKRLVNNTILFNLSLPLTDTTEEKWEEAFGAMEFLLYKNPMVDKKIEEAFENLQSRSKSFQRALLELAYTSYPSRYLTQTVDLLKGTNDPKIFAMSAEYILQSSQDSLTVETIEELMISKFSDQSTDPILVRLSEQLSEIKFSSPSFIDNKFFTDILNRNFLPGNTIMYSFQRKDRDFPGLVVIRNKDGIFVRDSAEIFNVPQLARSINNLPSYLTNGNTPQGIFRMKGFDVSMSMFIGPSPNVQLTMPGETSLINFFADSSIYDTIWNKEFYAKLLPITLQNYSPLYHSYYAGLAGRSEIIAHGTAINPEYFKGKLYYPHTPSLGCLSTKEIWNGKRLESNQKKLINGLLKAGGADGYCVVIELDDKKAAVTIEELLPHLLKAELVK